MTFNMRTRGGKSGPRVKLHPRPLRWLSLRYRGFLIKVQGWQSSPALAIYQTKDGYASAMMLTGLTLADGFASLEEAHTFNWRIINETKLRVGAVALAEVFESVGGIDAAQEVVRLARGGLTRPKRKQTKHR